jgi:hypothetical protein
MARCIAPFIGLAEGAGESLTTSLTSLFGLRLDVNNVADGPGVANSIMHSFEGTSNATETAVWTLHQSISLK